MKTSHKMFLRRVGKRGHEEVMVVIDWSAISDADVKLMASHYVLHRAEHDLKGYDNALPESIEYRAVDFVHNEPLVTLPEAPESWKSGLDKMIRGNKLHSDIDKALKKLTPEEIQILIKDLKECSHYERI